MLDKIKHIKFIVGKKQQPIVLLLHDDCSLVKAVFPTYKGKLNLYVGFNVYSVVRHIFANYNVDSVYRKKENQWIKINKDKIKSLAYEPMDRCL